VHFPHLVLTLVPFVTHHAGITVLRHLITNTINIQEHKGGDEPEEEGGAEQPEGDEGEVEHEVEEVEEAVVEGEVEVQDEVEEVRKK
jgi:hypothetical protein